MASRARSYLSGFLDFVCLILLGVAIHVVRSGGFVAWIGDLRISARTPERPLIAAAIVLILRIALDRKTGAFAIPWRRLAHGAALAFKRRDDAIDALPGNRWKRFGYAAAGLLGIAAILLHRQWQQPFGVPDLGDPYFSVWRMAWVSHQFFRDPLHLFDANIFYPEPLTLTYSDSMILPALTASPLLAVGLHPVLAYQLLFFSGFLFSGLAMYLLVERLTASPLAAFVSAAIFAFYPYRFEHYSHLELQMAQWMPLGLLALHTALKTSRPRYLLLFALALVAQLYSAMYYAVFFTLYAVALGLVLAVALKPAWPRIVAGAVAGAVLAGVLAFPIVSAYSRASVARGERGEAVVESYSARPSDYLRAHMRSATWAERMLPDAPGERALFPGVMPIALTAVALVPPLGVTRLAYAAGLLVAFDGSLGFNGLQWHYLYDWLSPVRNLRVPARFSFLVGMSLAVLAGFGTQRLLSRLAPRARQVALLVMIGALMIDVWPRLELVPTWREPPATYDVLRGKNDVVLAEFPVNPWLETNLRYQYFSIWHWARMPNGYSGNSPRSYYAYYGEVGGFPDQRSIAAMRALGITHVSYNCAFDSRGCGRAFSRIDALGALRLVSEATWEGEPVRLYELER